MEELAIQLNNVSKSYGQRELLRVEHLAVYQNEKIGIIGANGNGKSTLLKLLAGEILPDLGNIQREVDFAYFEQMTDLQESSQLDGELLSRFNVPLNPLETLSGGEGTKYRLVQVLSNYQLGLLLDEPTTHLDKAGIDYLISELQYYYGTLLVVSHDRYFLDKIAEKIWEVADGTIKVYHGNYSDYAEQKEAELEEQANAYEQFNKEKQRLEQAVKVKQAQAARLQNVSNKQANKRINPGRLAASKSKDSVVKATQKSAKAMESRLNQLEVKEKIETSREIQFPTQKFLEIHNPYPIMGEDIRLIRGDKLLLDQASFQFELNQKIALIGDNGSGKSSLLKWIIDEGEGITLSPKVKFAVYQQMDYKYVTSQTLIDYLISQTESKESFIRAILSNLGFSQSQITSPMNQLSGGEASKIAFAEVLTTPSNVLVMDEPTNFIDIQTINALEKTIESYPGTVLYTSHDQYFVQTVADQVYEISNYQLNRIK